MLRCWTGCFQLTAERDLSTKVARESVETAERKCALQTEALARSEARAAAAESRLRAAEEDAEAAREEDREVIHRASAIRESLEAEVRTGMLPISILAVGWHLSGRTNPPYLISADFSMRVRVLFALLTAGRRTESRYSWPGTPERNTEVTSGRGGDGGASDAAALRASVSQARCAGVTCTAEQATAGC